MQRCSGWNVLWVSVCWIADGCWADASVKLLPDLYLAAYLSDYLDERQVAVIYSCVFRGSNSVVECHPSKLEVASSNLVSRSFPAPVAQWIEQSPSKRLAVSSNLTGGRCTRRL